MRTVQVREVRSGHNSHGGHNKELDFVLGIKNGSAFRQLSAAQRGLGTEWQKVRTLDEPCEPRDPLALDGRGSRTGVEG